MASWKKKSSKKREEKTHNIIPMEYTNKRRKMRAEMGKSEEIGQYLMKLRETNTPLIELIE